MSDEPPAPRPSRHDWPACIVTCVLWLCVAYVLTHLK